MNLIANTLRFLRRIADGYAIRKKGYRVSFSGLYYVRYADSERIVRIWTEQISNTKGLRLFPEDPMIAEGGCSPLSSGLVDMIIDRITKEVEKRYGWRVEIAWVKS